MEILYKNKELVAVYKPAGVPSQSDLTGDLDAMALASQKLAELGEANQLWLVHRLDRVVGGVLVFARSKDVAACLSAFVGGVGMKKEYLAVVHGEAPGGHLLDYVYKDARQGKAFVVKEGKSGAKKAELEYTPIACAQTDKGILTLVRITLFTGRFHQIRVQLSSRGMSIVGDGKYGSHDNRAKMPALFASGLEFTYKKELFSISRLPDTEAYPWTLFDWSSIK